MVAVLAKLTRPRLLHVIARDRLFARLDACRESGAALWISGPPGAGKTTLAASWLDARSVPVLWYQVDSGDADAASFFWFLAQGARGAGLSKRMHLPLLTPEYRSDLPGFTRRFFRALGAGLPKPCAIVFDNVQDAPEAPDFAPVLRDALGEMPPGVHPILLSRDDPPAACARLRANEALLELGWDELRLTEDEAAGIAAGAGHPAAAAGELIRRCNGWAAGLTLLLDHERATGTITAEAPPSRQKLFDYFAAELFERLPEQTRQLLLRTALLPWVGVDEARVLSGNDRAGALLEGLRRRHLFTERRAGAQPGYRYHTLFSEFLGERLARDCAADERAALARQSARLILPLGEAEAALRLYAGVGDVQAAVGVILAEAPKLAAQGRLPTLAGWIEALPEGLVEAVPWLGYWLGIAHLGTDPPRARTHLEPAFDRFERAGDGLGQMVAAAAVIETHTIEFQDFTRFDPWIERLMRLLDSPPAFPDSALELRVYGSLIGALATRRPEPDLIERYAPRVRELIGVVTDANSRLAAAVRLLHYYGFLVFADAGSSLIDTIQPSLTHPRLQPAIIVQWLNFEALWFHLVRYDERRAQQATDRAIDLIDRHGLDHVATLVRARAASLRLEAGDCDGAARHLAHPVPQGEVRGDEAWLSYLRGWLAMLRGDVRTAVEAARAYVQAGDRVGMPGGRRMSLIRLANALAVSGEAQAAREALRRAENVESLPIPIDHVTGGCIAADLDLAAGDAGAAETTLRRAFAIARSERVFNTWQWLAPQMQRLCAFALERGIETDYVTELVRLRGLRPPSPDIAAWPWPVRILTLGRFAIELDGVPLAATGKAQHRPLALLGALVAQGGSDVPEQRLIDIAWAGSGADRNAFDVALHRLRKLLGHDDAIVVGNRRVSLNREIVWVDLFALERRLAGAVPFGHTALADPARTQQAVDAILDLYRGPFLDGEPDAAWLLPVRDRIEGRFQRFVLRLGDHWEAMHELRRADELYERALEIDPRVEAFWARRLACLAAQGRRSEAADVYRRCRVHLGAFGAAPGTNFEAVYRSLAVS